MTDSTIDLPKTSDFLSQTFCGWSIHGRMPLKTKFILHFLACRGLSIDDVGVSRHNVFHEIRPGAGFETRNFV